MKRNNVKVDLTSKEINVLWQLANKQSEFLMKYRKPTTELEEIMHKLFEAVAKPEKP